jgi:hypothetical protein
MRRWLAAWLVGLLVAAVPARAQTPVPIDGVAAVVNTKVITRSDVRAARGLRLPGLTASAPDDAVVWALVERHLVLLEVARYAMPDPTPEAVAARRREWAATLPAGFDLPAAFARYGLTEVDVAAWHKEDVRIRLYLDKLFSAAAQPTNAEIAAYVRDHDAELTKGGATSQAAMEADARTRLADMNRQKRIRDWIDGLKRRADISIR